MDKSPSPLLWLNKGDTVTRDGREYVILALADINKVLAKEVSSGQTVLLEIGDVGAPKPTKASTTSDSKSTLPRERDLLEVSDEDWAIAQTRLKAIERLLQLQEREPNAAALIARQAGVSRPTIYRWLQAYRNSGLLSSLLPEKRSGGRGKGRLPEAVEIIIQDRIENYYLTDQQPSIADTAEEVRRLCGNAELDLPHPNTVKKRIQWITERERVQRRRGSREAKQRFDAIEGVIPDAEWPLSIVEVDHTLLPVMIVHELSRQSIGRPWVTFAIDVYSRVILGMYLTLDAPSAMSAGMCISHAILGKEKWIASLGLKDADWPFYGVMGALHMDNAREFRGNMLKAACNEYTIDLMLRPVKTPHYGAHIERLMGTVSQRLKRVSGTTFSGPEEKGEYDSEAKAEMTQGELERWLALFVAWYHHRLHAGIGTSPLQKWREGLIGTKKHPGRGLPARRLDEEKVRIDFMPFEERTIQDYGVLIDDVYYFHDVLRPFINAPDPDNPRHKKLFRFRRDPRDISHLYFLDPLTQRYVAIPYRDLGLPPVSIWELRAAKKTAKEQNIKDIDERRLFGLINQQRQIEDDSAEKTKVARRSQQRRMDNDKARMRKPLDLPTVATPTPTALPPNVDGYDPGQIKPFDDEY